MKIKSRQSVIFLLLLVSSLYLYCDAPRNNPLDPKNPKNSFGSITGYVHTITNPGEPIQDVSVYWQNEDRLVFTNSNGFFSIENIQPLDGNLLFSRQGFFQDSVAVIWAGKKNFAVQVLLNAKPILDSLAVYSVILNRHPNLKTQQIVIKSKITDPDGDRDIDSVYVENSYLNIKSHLKYNVDDRLYERTFSPYDLHVNSLEKVVGYDFTIKVVDKNSRNIKVGVERVQRVIHEEIKYDSPANYQMVSATPKLRWHNFNPGFEFTFMIQIFTGEFIVEKVWEKTGIPSNRTDFTVDINLGRNDYFWIIWCVDEFQNRASSKPASFTVE